MFLVLILFVSSSFPFGLWFSVKQSNDAQQARKTRAGVSSVSSTVSTTPREGQNGSHVQPQQNGMDSLRKNRKENLSYMVYHVRDQHLVILQSECYLSISVSFSL